MDLQSVLSFAAALGCGLVAGAFFAFSTFVMKALARLPAAQGIAAMQSINVAVEPRAHRGGGCGGGTAHRVAVTNTTSVD